MKKLLNTAGSFVLASIEENLRKGIDYEGKKFSYSEESFFRPYDARLHTRLKKSPDLFDIVRSKRTGKLGFIIHGYKKFKQFMNPQAAGDYLTWRGEMLRDMKILHTSDNEAVIGFSDPEQAQKAFWFNISGVGRSRKLWKFLGITARQQERLVDLLGEEYQKIVIEELGRIIQKI